MPIDSEKRRAKRRRLYLKHKEDIAEKLAQMQNGGIHFHLGYFDLEIDAAIARDSAAIIHRGRYAKLNLPLKPNFI